MTDYEQQTAQNRIKAITYLNFICSYAESQIQRAKAIPILDDEDHADWVQGYTDRICELCTEMSELATFGHKGGME